MKKIYLLIITLLFAINLTYAQWTISGSKVYVTDTAKSVGIGTTNPAAAKLTVIDGGNTFSGFFQGTAAGVGLGGSGTIAQVQGYLSGSSVNLSINPNGGNVGIGTTSPSALLHLYGTSSATDVLRLQFSASGGGHWAINPFISGVSNGGLSFVDKQHSTTPLVISDGDNIGIGTTSPSALLHLFSSSSATDMLRLQFNTSGGGHWAINPFISGVSNGGLSFVDQQHSTTPLVISDGGYVGIGVTNPDEMLSVDGTVHSKEVKVSLSGLPDYVFDKEYHLPALYEVKAYVDKNHHLPDVPSAAEVDKNGLKLGEMNATLLKKVEELTLYMIDLKKSNDELKKQNAELKKAQRGINNKLQRNHIK